MKYLPKNAGMALLLPTLFLMLSSMYPISSDPNAIPPLNGAWKITTGTEEQLLLVADNYCMLTKFNKSNKKFTSTMGGPFIVENKQIVLTTAFNSLNKSEAGKVYRYDFNIKNNVLTSAIGGTEATWTRADDGNSPLSGNWRITQRKQEDKMIDIPLRARRTLKLLSGNHFQWAAINVETGEFSGTGGGKYTFADGKYTEEIEFFSRDAAQVGASLSFEGKMEDGKWIHSGLSSKGDPIYEVWTRFR